MWRRALAAVDRWQRRSTPVAFAIGVAKKFFGDRASSLAALIAYYAFFSLFPLLLVLVSVVGLVLEDNPELQEDVLDTALARIPVIGSQLRGDVQSLSGSGIALAVGVAGALWAGLGVTIALRRAFDEIWDVPRVRQPGALKARLRGALVLLVLGIALVAATVASGLSIGGGIGPGAQRAATIAGSLIVNLIVYTAVFGLLTARPRSLRQVAPGVVIAAVGSLALQSLGGWYVSAAVLNASDTYGSFALVIGLMSWFWLLAHLVLIAAEVNVVLRRRLWPRSLTGELGPADRRALESAAAAARQDEREQIAVSFAETG